MVMLPPLQLADAVANAASFDLLPFILCTVAGFLLS